MIGVKQSSVNRYESGQSVPSPKNMIWYADYFDVSLDYIYGRTDNPQGKLYSYEPKAIREQFEDEEKMKRFIEFCFEPGTAGNEKLKSVLTEMLGGKK
jgi:transcriptional regulator with XRE-family HTH domain